MSTSNKICIVDGCNTYLNYNIDNTITDYCKLHSSEEHSSEDMINVRKQKCLEKDCNTHPSFNFKNETSNISDLNFPELK